MHLLVKPAKVLRPKFCPTDLQEHYQQSVLHLGGGLKQSKCQDFGMLPCLLGTQQAEVEVQDLDESLALGVKALGFM